MFRFFNWYDYVLMVVDIAVVSYVVYRFFLFIRGTRAVQLIKGLAVLAIAYLISWALNLVVIKWILDQLRLVILVALPVVFQPELRRTLEQLGRGRFFGGPVGLLGPEDATRIIDEVVRATQVMSRRKTGALVVLERETGLNEFMETGVKVDGLVSSELLLNIFVPNSPLHDGAAIIRGNRVAAAGCFLPLSDSPYLSKQLGTRHRAGLGISEISDAVVVIVSEETGAISVAEDGKLTRYLEANDLRQLLQELLIAEPNSTPWWGRRVKE
ncbi:MAG: TIGR00159 family protein [Clostridia bacterium]|nr:TIGR00159 family protein [Clostridia bacterium]